jgi:hypothetical protein
VINKIIDNSVIIILGIVLGITFFLFDRSCNINKTSETIVKQVTKIDTTFIQGKTPSPIIINKKVFLKRIDTVYLDREKIITNPFTIKLDTVTNDKDTVSFSYFYPNEDFSLLIKKPAPIIKVITITNTDYVTESNWNKALYFIGGMATMYVSQTKF